MTLRTAHPGYLFLLLLLIYSFPLLQSKFQKEERLLISADEHFSRTITIGAPISFDISDAHATSGSKMKHGWTMFTEWVNNRGGIKLHGENVSITLVCVEDYSNVTYVEDAVEYLLTFDSPIDFFLAPYSRLVFVRMQLFCDGGTSHLLHALRSAYCPRLPPLLPTPLGNY